MYDCYVEIYLYVLLGAAHCGVDAMLWLYCVCFFSDPGYVGMAVTRDV